MWNANSSSRFVDDALGFALTWNYWFNDAVSTASDIIALQLLLKFWTDNFPGWAISLIFLIVVIGLNVLSVRVYGEVEYWLSLLKVITIIVCCTILFLLSSILICSRYSSSSVSPSTAAPTPTTSISAARTGSSATRHSWTASAALPRSS